MHHFQYRQGELWAENVPVRKIAEEVGTPCYIYSTATVTDHFNRLREAFGTLDPLICYSIKANPCLALLKLLRGLGAGFDVVSGGELYRALRVGASPQSIVYAGVGKTEQEIREALEADILLLNAESESELARVNSVAESLGRTAPVALRLNPDVDPKTHRYITTGKRETKFGLDFQRAQRLIQSLRDFPSLKLRGLHCHIGSQITIVAPYENAARKLSGFLQNIRSETEIEWLDIGGGFGIDYRDDQAKPASAYAEVLAPLLKSTGCRIILEPGRFIVGNAGILLTELLYKKHSGQKCFYICDAGMNDLIRPSLYEAYHTIWPTEAGPPRQIEPGNGAVLADVVGPVCESGDFFARDRVLPDIREGALLAVFSAGAYGSSMASNYNSRPLLSEVLVEDRTFRVVRKRQSYEDILRGEID